MVEVAKLEFEYEEICQLLESPTIQEGSQLYVKLRAARDDFLRQPKEYGRGLRLRVKDTE